jgi:hypothetical protein
MAAPLFLLAPPRSYTSLMNAMLGQHPQAFGLPELCLFNVKVLKDLWVRETDEMENFSKTRHGLYRAVAEIYTGEQTSSTVTMAAHWCAMRQNWSTADIYRELAAQIHPLIPVEKSPAYTISVKRMQAMLEAFPDARFIHLTRDPIGQCKSVMNMNEGAFALYVKSIDFLPDRAIIEPQLCWHDLNLNIMEFLKTVPQEQQMRVRGEDIMNEPKTGLAAVCRWLGIRDDEEAIEQMMHPERSPFACFGPVNALFGNDPNFLSGPTFRPHKVEFAPMDKPVPWRTDGKGLRPEVISLARELGYGSDAERAGSSMPSSRGRIGPIDGDPVTTHPDLDALTPEQIAFRDALLYEFKAKKVKLFVNEQVDYIAPDDFEELAENAIDFLFDEHGRPPANAPIEDIIEEARKCEYADRWLEALLVQLRKRRDLLTDREGQALERLISAPAKDLAIPARQALTGASQGASANAAKQEYRETLENVVVFQFSSKKLRKFVEKHVTNIHMNVMIAQGAKAVFDESTIPPPDADLATVIGERRRMTHIVEWFEGAQAQIRAGLIELREIESQALDYVRQGYLHAAEKKSKSK